MNADLKELIVKAQSGDERAMQELIQRFRPAILRYSRRMGYDIDEAAQDLFEILIKTVKGFNHFEEK